MQRRLFIGSSREGLDKVTEIQGYLSSIQHLECVSWVDIFDPASFVLESLEIELSKLSGAILIATPDDSSEIRNQKVYTPRENVMLEFGLMSARLGRRNVVICQYGNAELPSDLRGLNVLLMEDPSAVTPEQRQLQQAHARKGLVDWASELMGTADAVPRTVISHGYSGRWNFQLVLDRWRDIAVKFPSFAEVNGELLLHIPHAGPWGDGIAHASLDFRLLAQTDPKRPSYAGAFAVTHTLSEVQCFRDGSIGFSSKLHCIQIANPRGEAWPELQSIDQPGEPWSFEWKLQPTPNGSRTLAGTFTSLEGKTEGRVIRAVKL